MFIFQLIIAFVDFLQQFIHFNCIFFGVKASSFIFPSWFLFLFAASCSMLDLSSPTRD